MAEKEPISTAPQSSAADLRLENMAYATQSMFVNLGANIVEPFIGGWVQRTEAKKRNQSLDFKKNYFQNLVGEFAGDIGGNATLFIASALAPQVTQNFINFTGKLVHPLAYAWGHVVFRDEFNEPDYMAKVNKWARFQERNYARFMITTVGAVTANVAAQKYIMKNTSPGKVIIAGKLLSASLTNSLMFASRLIAPQKMKDLDRMIGNKLAGSEKEELPNIPAERPAVPFTERTQPLSYAERVQTPGAPVLEPSR